MKCTQTKLAKLQTHSYTNNARSRLRLGEVNADEHACERYNIKKGRTR